MSILSVSLREKATIHQMTIMLATSKNVLFPGHNHMLTTGTDTSDTWIITQAPLRVIIQLKGNQYSVLASDYDLEIGHFKKWIAWWLPGG